MSNEALLKSLKYSVYAEGSTKQHEYVAEVLEHDFVIIPKADLPSVKRSEHDENVYYTDGENVVYTSEDNARMWCLRDIAVWQFIAAEGATRNNRRDELARELVSDGAYAYRFAEDPLKAAIDRIIELESK